MAEAGAVAAHAAHEDHHELGFIRTYIFSTDHKMIGRQFLITSLLMLVVGGIMAMMMRWQLAWPERPLPVIGASQQFIDQGEAQTEMDKTWEEWLSKDESEQNWLTKNIPTGTITPSFYNSLFTMHATLMIFFVVMPFMVGCFGNFLIPLMIGARDMAFPLLNLLSFWTAVPANILIIYSLFVPGGAAAGGWTMYA
ncbi:MAG: cbb3-type cytochrome c oxidase subunit I, partial [Candidatus Binatia bacterium]